MVSVEQILYLRAKYSLAEVLVPTCIAVSEIEGPLKEEARARVLAKGINSLGRGKSRGVVVTQAWLGVPSRVKEGGLRRPPKKKFSELLGSDAKCRLPGNPSADADCFLLRGMEMAPKEFLAAPNGSFTLNASHSFLYCGIEGRFETVFFGARTVKVRSPFYFLPKRE